MKTYAHDTVRRLMELLSLEERLARLQRSHQTSVDEQALIESLRSNLPLTVLMNHQRMRKRDKQSVGEVRHGVCTGCHLTVAVGNVAALRRGDLRQCGNCGRYLYLVEEEEEEVASVSEPHPARNRRTKSGETVVESPSK
jgi:predicted  nucleic acid-binding Zn-ribbon protein